MKQADSRTAQADGGKHKLGRSVAEELRFALADIRQAHERAWFGEAVTPAREQDDAGYQAAFERLFGRDPKAVHDESPKREASTQPQALEAEQGVDR